MRIQKYFGVASSNIANQKLGIAGNDAGRNSGSVRLFPRSETRFLSFSRSKTLERARKNLETVFKVSKRQ